MNCPVCLDSGLALGDGGVHPPRPCPRCRVAPPGRLLKAQEGETLEGDALHKALSE